MSTQYITLIQNIDIEKLVDLEKDSLLSSEFS